MRLSKRKNVILAGLLAIVAGCLPKLERPEVWLEGARLASIGLSGGIVDVTLSIYNPNRFELRARGLTYDLDLEDGGEGGGWIDFTEGRLDRDLRVQAGDTVEISVPVEFSYSGIGRMVRGLLDRGAFDYRISGIVALEGPVRREIDYRHQGTVTSSGVR